MDIKSLLFAGCAIIMVSAVNAQSISDKKESSSPQTVSMASLEEHANKLMADRVGFKKEIVVQELAAINEKIELANEDLLFPADELYDSNWDMRWVDPFRGKTVSLPDSCSIDCSSFILPIGNVPVKITSKFGPRRRRMHKGIDLKVQVGDTIYAAFSGKVRIRNFERRGYGNYVVIRHPNGLETIYGHLSKALVNVNQIVHAGEPIALGGNTGRSSGSHLHFETRLLGHALNPADLFDFENGVPHQDAYVFHNMKINGKNSNIYVSSTNQMVYHRVKSGETLGKIARQYGVTIAELCRLNGIRQNKTLRIGQSLRCSMQGSNASQNKGKSLGKTVETKNKSKATVASTAGRKQIRVEASTSQTYYKIKSGDTLGAIAKKYSTSISKLCELNGISKTTTLRLGRALIVKI